MPVNKKLMRSLKKEYGEEKGERVYYAMEAEGKVSGKKGHGRRKKRER